MRTLDINAPSKASIMTRKPIAERGAEILTSKQIAHISQDENFVHYAQCPIDGDVLYFKDYPTFEHYEKFVKRIRPELRVMRTPSIACYALKVSF